VTTPDGLFEIDAPPPAAGPPERLSPDRRRTQRQRAAVDAGRHPLSLVLAGIRVNPDPTLTCGNCHFRQPGRYPKCLYGYQQTELPPGDYRRRHGATHSVIEPRATHGAATDTRAWWPACTDHQPAANC
jgi:hypothetical protein